MAAAPSNNNGNNNKSKQSQAPPSKLGNLAYAHTQLDESIDVDQASWEKYHGHRGVPVALSSHPRVMGYQESFDNYASAKPVGSIMQVWGPKVIHEARSIPKDGGSDLGSKGGSYTLEATTGAKQGAMQIPFISSKLDADKVELVVTEKAAAAPQQQQSNITELKENIELKEPYRDPTDEYANNEVVTPLVYNPDYCSIDCPGSRLDADQLKEGCVVNLNVLVKEGFIDWNYENRYTIQGRIYKNNEDAGVRVTVYALEDDSQSEYQSMLEVRRNGGDSFLFQEFKSKFLSLMSDSGSIDYEKGPDFTMEHGFLASDFSELPQLADSDLLSGDDNDDFSFLTPLSSMSNTTMGSDLGSNFDANSCVAEATDTKQYRELYRESVGFLRNAADDESKLTDIMAVDNIIDKLLIPIHGNRQIYDTLVIKSLLEVIYEIVKKDASLASEANRVTIKGINQQWDKPIQHPLSDTIEGFLPSQQIQWITRKCIDTFGN